MILDYNYSKKKHELTISYITEAGSKKLLKYNVSRFKSYYETPNGQYINWNGNRCDVCYTEKPEWCDIKTFIEELPERDKKLILGKHNPKLYTFDIEVQVSDEFPEPSIAKYPIYTISIVNEKLQTVVLGTRKLDDPENKLQQDFTNYLNTCEFYKKLQLETPQIVYKYFETEHDMLVFFLKEIVSKAPVLAGWNSIGFDWQYICNRIKFYYSDINLNMCSIDWSMQSKNFTDMKGQKTRLSMPNHTLVLDMMDVIDSFDMVVMPIKENLSLDYIASESPVGLHKIKYDGDLEHLYNTDYSKYVFYNAIDSVLVQLINVCFSTLNNIYTQSLYCRNKISAAFSKIALSESLFFNHFYENGIKIVPTEKFSGERGELQGAYVRQPTPGKWKWMTCNDFAGLYPSTIITNNLSIENYLGKVGEEFTEEQIETLKKDPNYMVSVNGCVYKNDRDYAFRLIQSQLKANRGIYKYLGKKLDALVMLDIEHIEKGSTPSKEQYPDDVKKVCKDLGYPVTCGMDILNIQDRDEFKRKLKHEITYCSSFEQAMKLLMNSMYGGSSHVAFAWFNINLANDITGEARNLIHMMETHIPNYFKENWASMTDFHKLLGIQVNMKNLLKGRDLIELKYGDTDSLYMSYEGLLSTIVGIDKMSIHDKTELIAKINTEFLNGHNKQFMDAYYKSRFCKSVHEFELETIALAGIWLNVKKRYAQILTWKDGKYFDEDSLPLKVKGLEVIKSSYPSLARKELKMLVRSLIELEDNNILHTMNQKMQEAKTRWMGADIESICPTSSVNNYTKYIVDDTNPLGLQVAPKCPAQVRGLGEYNRLRQTKNLPGDPLYGGKCRYYVVKEPSRRKGQPNTMFAFQASAYPKWADEYAPIDRIAMFEKCVLDPFNRILEAMSMTKLSVNGYIQVSLFDDCF